MLPGAVGVVVILRVSAGFCLIGAVVSCSFGRRLRVRGRVAGHPARSVQPCACAGACHAHGLSYSHHWIN